MFTNINNYSYYPFIIYLNVISSNVDKKTLNSCCLIFISSTKNAVIDSTQNFFQTYWSSTLVISMKVRVILGTPTWYKCPFFESVFFCYDKRRDEDTFQENQ